jgi:orotate phosphoribosyltransferase
MPQQALIKLLLQKEALQFGDFTLKSGRKSPYFFNLGKLNDAESLNLLGKQYAQTILDNNLACDGLFGPAYKGIPLACFTASQLQTHHNHTTRLTFNRKEIKSHGEGGNLVGAPPEGNLIIIDDVMTQGTAVSEAIELIKTFPKAKLTGIIVALDRQERLDHGPAATQMVAKIHQVPVHALITMQTLIEHLPQTLSETQQQAMRSYQARYCHTTQTSS